jgi:hypothetical protein
MLLEWWGCLFVVAVVVVAVVFVKSYDCVFIFVPFCKYHWLNASFFVCLYIFC